MSTRPNPIPTMIETLKRDERVAALCGDNIFGGKVPPFIADLMPINAVVLSRAGGVQDSPDLPMHSYRIQATCYGGGKEPDSIDEYEASLVSSAVADAFCELDGSAGVSIYDAQVVIKSITLVGGPGQVKDIDMNNVPAEVLFFRVLMPTVQLVMPY